MNCLRHCLTLAGALAAIASQASITSYTEVSSAEAHQYDDSTYYFLDSVTGPPIAWTSPSTTNTSAGGDTLFTSAQASASVVTASSFFLEAKGDFGGTSYVALGAAPGGAQVGTDLLEQIYFSVDTTSSVTVSAFGTVAIPVGAGVTTNVLYVDGVLHNSGTDGTYTVNVAAGSHLASFYGAAYTNGAGYASMSADYDLQIKSPSVPEPATMSVLAVGLVGLIKRRKLA